MEDRPKFLKPMLLSRIGCDHYDGVDDLQQLAIRIEEYIENLKVQWKIWELSKLKLLIRKVLVNEISKIEERKLTKREAAEIERKRKEKEENLDLEQQESKNGAQSPSKYGDRS